MIWRSPSIWTMEGIEAAIARDDPAELWQVPIAASMHSPELAWAESVCLRLAKHANHIVRGNAVLGFGHLARRYADLDESTVRPLIEAALSDPEQHVRDHARTAAGDLAHFLGWHFDLVAIPLSMRRRNLTPAQGFSFWVCAWLGTAAAGGVFGFILGACGELGPPTSALEGLLAGFVFAGFLAVPIHITIAVVTWGLFLSRFRVVAAALAGALTGGPPTAGLTIEIGIAQHSDLYYALGLIALAVLLGGSGSALAGFLCLRRFRHMGPWDKSHDAPGPWQFTLRDLFVHFTVLAVLISLWTCVIRAIGH